MGLAREHARAFFGMLAPAGTPAGDHRARAQGDRRDRQGSDLQAARLHDRGLEGVFDTSEEYGRVSRGPTAYGRSTWCKSRDCSRSSGRRYETWIKMSVSQSGASTMTSWPAFGGLEGPPGLVGLAFGIALSNAGCG